MTRLSAERPAAIRMTKASYAIEPCSSETTPKIQTTVTTRKSEAPPIRSSLLVRIGGRLQNPAGCITAVSKAALPRLGDRVETFATQAFIILNLFPPRSKTVTGRTLAQ